MQIEPKENIIVKFCNSIWIERGLSNHTIESYKRDLLQYDLWLNEKSIKIIDASSENPLFGANIIIVQTQVGISADEGGYFNLINVPPGKYSVKAMMIGYETVNVEDVIVSVNRTTSIDIKMKQSGKKIA